MSFLQQRAAEVATATEARDAKAAARRRADGTRASTPRLAPDPEHVRAPGRTLVRPAWWPDEEPAWPTPEPGNGIPHPSHKPSHGKRSGGLCPVCHETRTRYGVCWCGSEEPPTRRGRNRVVVRPAADREPAWFAAHRRLHPQPGATCARCQQAHGLDGAS